MLLSFIIFLFANARQVFLLLTYPFLKTLDLLLFGIELILEATTGLLHELIQTVNFSLKAGLFFLHFPLLVLNDTLAPTNFFFSRVKLYT